MLSFMGAKQGRILQAYFTNKTLRIFKSHLCDFSTPEKAEEPLQWFLQYMASSAVGNTAPNDQLGQDQHSLGTSGGA